MKTMNMTAIAAIGAPYDHVSIIHTRKREKADSLILQAKTVQA